MPEAFGYILLLAFFAACIAAIPITYRLILRILHDLSKSVSGGWEKGKGRR